MSEKSTIGLLPWALAAAVVVCGLAARQCMSVEIDSPQEASKPVPRAARPIAEAGDGAGDRGGAGEAETPVVQTGADVTPTADGPQTLDARRPPSNLNPPAIKMRTASMGRRSALAAERAIEMAANRTSTSLPLVVLVGDSRMDSVVRAIKPKGSIAFAESVTLGDFGEASVLFLTSDTLPSLQFLNPFTDSIMALAPSLIVVQAEMLVPNSARIKRIGDHRPIAQGGLGQRGGTLAQWRAQQPPEAGLDFTVGERWAAAAAAASIPMLYLEIPLSVSVMAVVPDGYFEARRALLTPLGGAFVRLGEPLADDHFRDLRHVNRVGRDAVQTLLVTELARHL